MTGLRYNIAANAIASVVTGLIGLAVVPIYLHQLGAEAFGLVGLMTTLQAISVLLDFGLGATITREMARLSAEPNRAQTMGNLLRTLELVYWVIAAIIGITVMLAAPWIATRWIQADTLAPELLVRSIKLMGAALMVQWPFAVYVGTLTGLQNQILLGWLKVLTTALRSFGSAAVLFLGLARADWFFASQAVLGLLGTLLFAYATWRHMPASSTTPRFDPSILRNIWRFTIGVGIISVQVVILTQVDKILLIRILPLEWFGYYALANTVAINLYRLTTPLTSVFYPRLVRDAQNRDPRVLIEFYHRASQSLAVAVLPIAAVIIAFPDSVLRVWTHNADAALHAAPLLSLLFAGTTLNQIMAMPYLLQLSMNWTKLTIKTNAILIVFQLPALWYLTHAFGAKGSAAVWLCLNVAYFLITPSLMHARLLPGEKIRWYLRDVGNPTLAASAVLLFFWPWRPLGAQPLYEIFFLGITFGAGLIAVTIASPFPRQWLAIRWQHAMAGLFKT